MQNRIRIGEVGIQAALRALLPKVRDAGQLAARLQPLIANVRGPEQKEADHVARALLTHADLLLEDRLGSDVLMLFEDASFHGEEHASDRISQFIPSDCPYVITLDPINGTWQYTYGLPHYETILTICDRNWKFLGAIVYRPAFDEAFVAWSENGRAQAEHIRWQAAEPSVQRYNIRDINAPRALHLDIAWQQHKEKFRDANYTLVDIWTDFAGQADWPHSQADVLLGKCRAMVWKAPWSLHIDAAVFGFITECAGGVWRRGDLDRETLTYSYSIAAADEATADLLERLIGSV